MMQTRMSDENVVSDEGIAARAAPTRRRDARPRLAAGAAFAIALGVLASPPALAQDDSAMDREFALMDLDKDGRISAQEHANGARQMFESMDADRDGQVTAAEMQAVLQPAAGASEQPGTRSAEAMIKVVDADGDGRLSAIEHSRATRAQFEKMDPNSDGFLTMAELRDLQAQRPRR